MKKWMIGFLIALLLLLAFVYIFIPDTISLQSNITIKATGPGIHRMLLDKNNVAKWWPGKISEGRFYLNDLTYTINTGNITVMPVSVKGHNTDLNTSLFLISINADSTKLGWVGSTATSYNPVKRFRAYLEAKKINREMTAILQKMGNFYSMPENIYGRKIKKVLIVDSLLIATSGMFKGYPTTDFVYSLVNRLRNYAANNAANVSGYPMLHISTTDSIHFDVKVALPTDKILPSSGDILQKRMPANCIILVTEVKGGNGIATSAFEQMQKYIDDHQLKTAAISFYSLVTDRTIEPDTNKWVTKLYFPVMIYGSDTN
jgi:hypothetical protein